jgi:hypothetical protein
VADEMLIAPNDVLVVKAWNSITGQNLSIRIRYRTPDYQIVNSVFTMTPSADRLENTLKIALPARAFLIGVSVHTSVSTQRGQTFVRLTIAQDGTPPTEYLILAQDYVTVGASLSWPGGRISSPTEGPGAIRSITGTDPAPGTQSVEVVPTNARWRLLAWRATLTTDATAVTRLFPTLLFDDGANIFWVWFAPETVSASAIRRYNFAVLGVEHPNRSGEFGQPLPDLLLKANYRIRTSVGSFQAGDDWSAPQMLVEEWIDV